MNADDFGISDGVNRGILEAHQDGILTSTTLIVNTNHADEAVSMWKKHTSQLGLGLHINLSYGAPITDLETIPSLVEPDGNFPSSYEGVVTKSASFDPAELSIEINAQINRFIELTGQPPDHLDSHHHATYFHVNTYKTMLAIANQYQIPIRRKVALSDDHKSIADSNIFTDPEYAVRTTDNLDLSWYDGGATLENLIHILKNLPDGSTEIMCHPGYAINLDESYAVQRERELDILTNSDIKALIESEGIQLITFADLK
jgi:predicted glycoside hydrolase/deacetylase ChbG (UPF0249 family)